MIQVFRWLFRITVAFLVLLGIALYGTYWFASRSLPDYDKSLTVSGLAEPVEIIRNTYNVPHIFGQSDEDVFFGLGYVHAQDRLWQMELSRRTAQGRLSELFGMRTFETDKLMRTLDIYGHARRSVGALDAEAVQLLEAYARGVNARIEEVNQQARGRGAPEFFLFSPVLSTWTPADTLGVMNVLALSMSSSQVKEEVLLARALLRLSSERLQDLHPLVPNQGVAALPDLAALWPDLPTHEWAFAAPEFLSPLPAHGLGGASNAWAVGPERSATRGSFLANDPHLGLSAPSPWYLARLQLQTGGVVGATVPGVPLVMVGRSEVLGWGLTYGSLDDQDLFIEELNPQNPNLYRTPNGWAMFDTRSITVEINDAEPVTLNLRRTQNGVVLSPELYDVGSITPAGHVVSFAWTALTDSNTSVQFGLDLMKAQTVQEGMAAGRHLIAPSLNLVLADNENIGMQFAGRQVARHPENQSRGRIPNPGWIAENRWQGVLPYVANPRFLNPDGAVLVNTNNKIVDRSFPQHLTYFWGDTQRINRLERLLQARPLHDRDSFIETQVDTVSFTARALLPLIGRELWFTGEPAESATPERRRQDALELLAAWNGEMSEHLPEPLIYATWLRFLQDRLIRDELGPLADAYTHVQPLFIERVFRDLDGASIWCDVVQSSPRETCAQMARLALDEALVWLSERYGSSVQSLRWGDAHYATHDHPALGNMPGLGLIVNIRQSTSGGDNTLMRGKTSGAEPNPFANVHAATYRGIYDMADPESSVFIISTGQSGHPLSRHYDDLAELWRRGEYIPMTLDPLLARAGSVGITVLEPVE